MNIHAGRRPWPAEGLTRVPYWLYTDRDLYAQEQQRIFRGNAWTFLCLEAELPQPNAFRLSNLGDMPVVVTRDHDGAVHAFENRCAHRGSLLCLKERGAAKQITCVYHNWTYDLTGRLTGVAFRRGIAGKGGMPADCKPEEHAPRRLRTESFAGLVFGTLGADVPPLERYLGPDIAAHIRRVMRAPVKLLGGYTQILPSNWKLYVENTRDSYHASLLHMFFTTFRLNRLSQKGGLLVSESGGHHVSYSMRQDVAGEEYEQAGLRTAHDGYRLEAPELLENVDEFGDGIGLQILTVFPGFLLQQIRNSLAVRRVVPRGLDRTELVWTCFGFASDDEAMTERRLRQANLIGPAGFISLEDGAATGFVQRGTSGADDQESLVEMGGSGTASEESRVSEAAVRGFWKDYRRHMGI
ncbi:MAG TPA: aromatic ring-hydroxylating dioxygenase subunit alpha [Xanthobacteraceae bacterium]|nr:aromatic ring-hydroxylating dioxygenase subunit alpha [Xanthobacteraceae bacterium]